MNMKENEIRVQPPMVYVSETGTWEYKQLVCDLGEREALTENELNKLGAEGWELAGVFSESGKAYFYFKRTAQ
jgi:hypothetical protein